MEKLFKILLPLIAISSLPEVSWSQPKVLNVHENKCEGSIGIGLPPFYQPQILTREMLGDTLLLDLFFIADCCSFSILLDSQVTKFFFRDQEFSQHPYLYRVLQDTMSYSLFQGDTLNKKDIFGVEKGTQVYFDSLGRPTYERIENINTEREGKYKVLYIKKQYQGSSRIAREIMLSVKSPETPFLSKKGFTKMPSKIQFPDGYEALIDTFPSGIIRKVQLQKDGKFISNIE